MGLPNGPGFKSLPWNAGHVGSIPGWGTKLLHAMEQLSPYAITKESERSKERSFVMPQRSCVLQLIFRAEKIN